MFNKYLIDIQGISAKLLCPLQTQVLRLAFEQSTKWRSFSSPSEYLIGSDVFAYLIDNLEKKYSSEQQKNIIFAPLPQRDNVERRQF